jgi:hypothetical protein
VRRLLVLAALTLAAAAATAAPAQATNECRGFMICVPIAGPWVVVPTGTGVPRPRVEFQLTCPRGYIVGGLDAELSDRGIDVAFGGTLGSPVNPGITTSRSAVFVGTYVAGGARAPTFRPHVGCIPAQGGGGRVPTAARAVFPPGKPTERRVRTVRVRPGSVGAAVRCAAAERLVGGSHAVGFYGSRPPGEALARSVTARHALALNHVTVVIRAAPAVARVRAVVQVAAVCAGGQ